MSRSRSWCYTAQKESIAERLFEFGAAWIVEGRERCPTTKKRHWQGFVVFKNARTMQSILKEVPGTHLEVAKGSADQNYKYCTKDGKFVTFGERPVGQGKRSDLDRLVSHFKEGGNMLGALEIAPGTACRNMTNLYKLEHMFSPPRDWIMDVRIYYGKPGSGKTRAVYDEFGFDAVFKKQKNKWWDGYTGQDVILIDDFDPDSYYTGLTFDYWLELLDRYPMSLEVKGGTCMMRSHIVIITSNFDPKDWFAEQKNRSAFFRRVTTMQNFDTKV